MNRLSILLGETNSLLRVLVRMGVQEIENSQAERISYLLDVGFRPTEIAAILGISPNSVSVELHRQREKGEPSARKKKAKS